MLIESNNSVEMTFPDETVSLVDVARYGYYYNPAIKRYPGKKNISVTCDKCLKKNLTACISKDKYDICLKCCNELCEDNILVRTYTDFIYNMY